VLVYQKLQYSTHPFGGHIFHVAHLSFGIE
jgi:hypothetical protein